MHGFYDFCYTTLQMNTNHTGKFTTLRAMYIPYLVFVVSEMTYNVSSGTLNPTIPYPYLVT